MSSRWAFLWLALKCRTSGPKANARLRRRSSQHYKGTGRNIMSLGRLKEICAGVLSDTDVEGCEYAVCLVMDVSSTRGPVTCLLA